MVDQETIHEVMPETAEAVDGKDGIQRCELHRLANPSLGETHRPPGRFVASCQAQQYRWAHPPSAHEPPLYANLPDPTSHRAAIFPNWVQVLFPLNAFLHHNKDSFRFTPPL